MNAAALEGVDLTPVVGGATRLVGYGETKFGYGAVCLLDIIHTVHTMEPHVTWFPWVSAKGRLKSFEWAVKLMAETHQVLLHISKANKEFYDHFEKKGLLRKVGYIDNLPEVEEIHIYQVIK